MNTPQSLPAVRDPELWRGLSAFLDSAQVPAFSMNVMQLDGYLRAVCLAPGKWNDEHWLSLVFNEQEPAYQSPAQKTQVLTWLRQLCDFHCAQIAQNLCNLPCQSVYARLQDDRVDLEQWARGALQGYIIREDDWNNALTRMTNRQTESTIGDKTFFDDLDAILAIVSTVADAEYAVETGATPESLPAVFASFPDVILRWGHLGRRVQHVSGAE